MSKPSLKYPEQNYFIFIYMSLLQNFPNVYSKIMVKVCLIDKYLNLFITKSPPSHHPW